MKRYFTSILIGTLLVASCGRTAEWHGAVDRSGTDDAGGANPSDASGSGDDGSALSDAGQLPDSDLLFDVGFGDIGSRVDSGLDPSCSALEACCVQLGGRLQQGCQMVVQRDDPMICQSSLSFLEQSGRCDTDGGPLPPPFDGGMRRRDGGFPPPPFGDGGPPPFGDGGTRPRRDGGFFGRDAGDGGPLGVECTTLLDCCANAPPQVVMQCQRLAEQGNENTCAQVLNVAGQFCPSVPDGG